MPSVYFWECNMNGFAKSRDCVVVSFTHGEVMWLEKHVVCGL